MTPVEASAGTGERLRSGFLWNAGLNLLRELLQFATMLVLVRRLGPSAYGEFGLVTSIVGFFTVISIRPFVEYTLQLPQSEKPDYQNVFTIGGLIQAGVIAMVNVAALLLGLIPRYSPIAPLLHAMSVLFLLDWISELRVKMLERELNWARLRTLQGVGMLLNSGCALVLAFAGAGVYALLIPGLLVTVPMIWDLLVRARWRPEWTLSWRAFLPAFRYGMARIGSGIVLTGRQLAESAMLVNFLGFAGAGIYGRALGLATLACLRFPSYLTLTLYPVLSRTSPGAPAGRRASLLVLQSILWSIVPTAAVMAVLAGPVIQIVYGDKWLSAASLIPWTLLVTGLTAITQALTVLLLVNQREKQCLYADLIASAGIVLSLLLLLPAGVDRYLMGVSASLGLEVAGMVWWLWRADAIELMPLAQVVAAPAAVAAILLALVWPVHGSIARILWPAPSIVVFSAAFLGVYVLALRIAAPQSVADLVAYCPGKDGLRRILRLP